LAKLSEVNAVSDSSPSRFDRIAIAGALVVACGFFVLSIFNARQNYWNAIRLTPAVALLHGLPIYAPESSGVLTGHIYTPLGALAYSPIAWLNDISTMVSAGSLLALIYFSLPFIWLAVGAVHRGQLTTWDAAGVTVAALLVATLDPGLRSAALDIHVEAPAVGLASLAVVIASEAATIGSWKWAGAGALAVGAILSKQTLLPTWFALGLVIATCWGRAASLRYVTGSALASGLFFGGLMLFGDWHTFLYNTIWIPGHSPWRTLGWTFAVGAPPMAQGLNDRARALVGAFWQTRWWWPAFVVALWCLLRRLRARTADTDPLSRATVFAAAVVVGELPLALAGYANVGGEYNAFAPLLTPLLLLLAALALIALSSARGARLAPSRHALAAVLIVLIGCNSPRMVSLARDVSTRAEPNRPILEYLRAHPGEVYLPWDPLHTWVAEARRDHFDYGVFDRALAGRPITAAHYRAYLPPHLRWVAVRRGWGLDVRMRMVRYYLPNLRRLHSPEGLDAWVFYEVSQSESLSERAERF
jgi:hypothetical protein